MADDGRQRLSIGALAGRCLGIVAGAFALGLLVGHLMSGGEAAHTTEPASALPLVPVTVRAQPAAPTLPPQAASPSATPTSSYVVQPGDSLTTIAGQFGVSVQAIASANAITQPNALEVGQVLVIPGR
jgi:LysM repeat protein